MRAVWSLWTGPMRDSPRGSGWPTLRHHLMAWALSLETCRRYFAETVLVTDDAGARLLVDGMGLEFDEVTTPLGVLDTIDGGLWAMGKLYAYRAQERPFLHIDSDVFLWRAPPPAFLQGDVCAAYPEDLPYGNDLYRCSSFKAAVRAGGGWIPEELDAYLPHGGIVRAENCAVLGGHRTDFIADYADRAIAMLHHPANRAVWARRDGLMQDMLIFEQHLLTACMAYHAPRTDSAFAGITPRYLFEDYHSAIADAETVGFTHLVAGAKHAPEILARLDARVAADLPEFHARACALDAAQ